MRRPEYDSPRFRQLWNAGVSVSAMAAEFGVSKQAICGAARVRGLPARRGKAALRRPEYDTPEFRADWMRCVPLRTMAEKYDRSISSIVSAAQNRNLPPRHLVRAGRA